MKKIIYILGLLLVFSSCSKDYLEVKTQSSLSDDVVFSNENYTLGAIMGLYEIFGENNSYRNRLGTQEGLNTDIEFRPGASLATPLVPTKSDDQIPLYFVNSDLADGYNNTDKANPWSLIYMGIERANLCIAGIRKYGNPAEGNQMGDYLGEALALRAYFYYDLIKWWGDVPFRTDPLNASNLYVSQTNRTVIYNQIIADLGEAEKLMFPSGMTQTNTIKRFSRDAVRGLRARICLSAAGKAMLPASSDDRINSKIDYVFSDVSRRDSLYKIAREECKAIITDGRYKLDPSFKNVFYQECQDIETHGREVIFELPYNMGVRGRWIYWFGLKRAGDGKYVAKTLSSTGGNVYVMPGFYYDFDANDTRRDITCQPYEVKITGGVPTQTVTNITSMYLAKYRAEWCKTMISGTDDGVSPIALRYADVLLMYAETDLYLGGTDGATYFNQVRRRAFGKDINTVSNIDLPLTLDNLKKERAFEFCGENIRKYDLERWGELKFRMDSAKVKMQNLRDGTGAYANVPNTIYTQTYVMDASTGEIGLHFYGLNRGETDDKTLTDPAGKWTKVAWTNATSSNIVRLNDTWINSIYLNDPDKRQLLPIMSAIINSSNGKLSNYYGYNN